MDPNDTRLEGGFESASRHDERGGLPGARGKECEESLLMMQVECSVKGYTSASWAPNTSAAAPEMPINILLDEYE